MIDSYATLRNLAKQFADAQDAVDAGSSPADPSQDARLAHKTRLLVLRDKAFRALRKALEPENTHELLRDVVACTSVKKGWFLDLVDDKGALRLRIIVEGYNNLRQDEPFRVAHMFPVPSATYNERSWRRWVFDCCRGVENHELGECFLVGDERPFYPMHGPGENPYVVHEIRPEIDALTTQDGSLRERE